LSPPPYPPPGEASQKELKDVTGNNRPRYIGRSIPEGIERGINLQWLRWLQNNGSIPEGIESVLPVNLFYK